MAETKPFKMSKRSYKQPKSSRLTPTYVPSQGYYMGAKSFKKVTKPC